MTKPDKSKSRGKTVFYGVRQKGNFRPNEYLGPTLEDAQRWKNSCETILDDWEIVSVTVEPVKKGKK